MEKKSITLSVVLATYNEEKSLRTTLSSVQALASEIVVVDGGSNDKTVEIAKSFGAIVIETDNPPIFHINKQKAIDASNGEWVLQLDADEVVTPLLGKEIQEIIIQGPRTIVEQVKDSKKRKLFLRHQKLIERRDGKIGKEHGEIAAFFVPRRNFFLGKPMTYAGLYPDGVIRLVRRGKARFPCKSVHEQIRIDGKVSWLSSDLLHFSNSSFLRYIKGAHSYTSLVADELRYKHTPKLQSSVTYLFVKPLGTFIELFIVHKGFLDGFHGFLFSLFSSFHYPIAYAKYVLRH